jgi:ribonuclease J
MLTSKHTEYGGAADMNIKTVPLNGRFTAGPFDVELVSMAHSIPETSALAIRTPLGLIFHTADWKLDATPLLADKPRTGRIAELGNEGVLALVCDSTNAMRSGRSPSETEVAGSLAEIIKNAKNRVLVTTFSSNVARIKAVADAARAAGRRLVVAGRALHRVIQVAMDTGYLPQDLIYLDQREFQQLDRREVVCLCTGSQGEPNAALARIADMDHPDIKLAKGDLVIFSSRTIPGNEKEVGRIQNGLVLQGCDVLTDGEALVHVTGHPRQDELKEMYAWTRPRIAIPMHGEARHLKAHAALARAAGVAEVVPAINGEMVRIAPGSAAIFDDAPVGRLFRDGKLIVPSEDGPVRQRRKLAAVGVIIVALVLSPRGELMSDPKVVIDGVPEADADGYETLDVALGAVESTLKSIPAPRRKDHQLIEDAVYRAVRAAVASMWGKKPVVKVLISIAGGRD